MGKMFASEEKTPMIRSRNLSIRNKKKRKEFSDNTKEIRL